MTTERPLWTSSVRKATIKLEIDQSMDGYQTLNEETLICLEHIVNAVDEVELLDNNKTEDVADGSLGLYKTMHLSIRNCKVWMEKQLKCSSSQFF